MGLKHFHILFITLSVALCIAFGYWNLQMAPSNSLHKGLGLASLIFAFGLSIYGVKFYRKIKKIIAPAVFVWVLLGSSKVWACAVCFGDPADSQVKGMNGAILFLLGFVLFFWVGIAAFFIHLNRISKRRNQDLLA